MTDTTPPVLNTFSVSEDGGNTYKDYKSTEFSPNITGADMSKMYHLKLTFSEKVKLNGFSIKHDPTYSPTHPHEPKLLPDLPNCSIHELGMADRMGWDTGWDEMR